MSKQNIKLKNTKENFQAGKVRHELEKWKQITKDQWILNTILGYKLEVTSLPVQSKAPLPYKFNQQETELITVEIKKFLNKGIIEMVDNAPEAGEFISNIFYRPKPENKIRIILNLKPFNEKFVDPIHFKMETLSSATAAMRKNCWFASIDLADAFYSIPVKTEDRKLLRFTFQGQKYQFCALVMGLGTSPRVFTKVLKPAYATLRAKGHVSTGYIDDSCLQAQTKEQCTDNVMDTITLFDNLGLTINIEKSVLQPCQKIIFLGFLLCSITMTIRLTESRKNEIQELCHKLISKGRITIRDFAKLIGKLVAAIPGVEYAPLYIKPLEKTKETELSKHNGNYNSFMNISPPQIQTLQWWIENVSSSYKKVSWENPKIILFSDSSKTGWGGYNQTNGQRTWGLWSTQEQNLHINILELKACELTIKALCEREQNVHIKIYMDNQSSVAYIQNFGGRKSELDQIARNLWFWCIERKLHISAAHIPGSENQDADELSRNKNEDTEWSLDQNVFNQILTQYPNMKIDLFASRLNKKLPLYVSRFPDHEAYKIDAFTFTWKDNLYFMFPPFSILPQVLQKIAEDKTDAVLICPLWTTQTWWPSLLPLICAEGLLLPPPRTILKLEHKPQAVHPLQKMRLVVLRLSGEPSKCKKFQNQQGTLSYNLGATQQRDNTTFILENGFLTAEGRQIPLNPIPMKY